MFALNNRNWGADPSIHAQEMRDVRTHALRYGFSVNVTNGRVVFMRDNPRCSFSSAKPGELAAFLAGWLVGIQRGE